MLSSRVAHLRLRFGGLRHGVQDGPDEAAEFSRCGGDGDMTMFALIQATELFVESVLGFECDGNNSRGLTLTPTVEDQLGVSPMPVVPSRLDEKSSCVHVAGYGDGSPAFLLAGGTLGGDESEVSHQCAGRAEATDVIDLSHQGCGGEGFDTTQAAEGLYRDPIRWGLRVSDDLIVEDCTLHLQVLEVFEFGGNGGVKRPLELIPYLGQPLPMFLGPGGFTFGEDVTVITQDAGDAVFGGRAITLIGVSNPQ